MAQELELSDHYTTVHELQGTKANRGGSEQSASSTTKSLLRIGILTLAVLCILQVALNISLRLAFHSKEDTDQFPFSIIADVCQIDQSQHNSTQSCSCCKNLLRKLLREYHALEKERDVLRDQVGTREDDRVEESGSGTLQEFLTSEISGYR